MKLPDGLEAPGHWIKDLKRQIDQEEVVKKKVSEEPRRGKNKNFNRA